MKQKTQTRCIIKLSINELILVHPLADLIIRNREGQKSLVLHLNLVIGLNVAHNHHQITTLSTHIYVAYIFVKGEGKDGDGKVNLI